MSSIGNYQNVSSWYNNVNLYSSTSGSGRTNNTQAQMSGQSKTDPMSQTLDSLVSSGTITGDQESAIKSAIESSMAEASYTRYKIQASASDSSASASSSSTQTDPLASLVEAGTLTQDQADAVKNALDEARDAQGVQPPPPPPPPPPQQGAEQISDTLSSLVDDGTIDSTTASSVLEAIKAAMESVQSSSSSSSSDSSDTSDDSDSTEGSNSLESILSSLVSSDSISQEDSDAILSALQESMNAQGAGQPPPPPPPPPPSGEDAASLVTSTLDSLVTAGTITSDQSKSILESLMEATASEETDSSTASSSATNPLDALVSKGTITSDQESLIASAFQSAIQAYAAQYSFNGQTQANAFEVSL